MSRPESVDKAAAGRPYFFKDKLGDAIVSPMRTAETSSIRCEFSLEPFPAAEGYLTRLRGEAVVAQSSAPAAAISAVAADLGAIWSSGESVEQVFGVDPGLRMFHEALFAMRPDGLPEFISLAGAPLRLLIVRRLETLPGFRGKGLGRRMILEAAQQLSPVDAVLLEACPLQRYAALDHESCARLRLTDFDPDIDRATDRLVAYYRRHGFRELRFRPDGHRILAMSLPTL